MCSQEEEMDILDRLEGLKKTIYQKDFLENKGLGNEVGYYIFDYPPQEELVIRQYVTQLEKKNDPKFDGFEIKIFNLYQLMIEYLKERNFIGKVEKMEEKRGLEAVIKNIGQLLRLDYEEGNFFVDYIVEHTPEKGVIILTGIGELYPIVRAHSLLNTLHQVMDRVPVIMMYPGEYDSLKLTIFNTNKDDNYYRAFRMD